MGARVRKIYKVKYKVFYERARMRAHGGRGGAGRGPHARQKKTIDCYHGLGKIHIVVSFKFLMQSGRSFVEQKKVYFSFKKEHFCQKQW